MSAASLSPVVVTCASNSAGGSAPSSETTASCMACVTAGGDERKKSCMSTCGGLAMASWKSFSAGVESPSSAIRAIRACSFAMSCGEIRPPAGLSGSDVKLALPAAAESTSTEAREAQRAVVRSGASGAQRSVSEHDEATSSRGVRRRSAHDVAAVMLLADTPLFPRTLR